MTAATDSDPTSRVQKRVATTVTAGMIGVVETLLAISLGGLIFAGALEAYLGTGIGMAMFAALVFLVALSLWSGLKGAIGSVQDVTAVVLAVVAGGIVTRLGPDDPRLLGTVIAAIAFTTFLAGVFLWALGTLRLGQLARFVPYPVIGGFLAGTGWLLLVGGVGLFAPEAGTLADLTTWTDPDFLWRALPGLAFAILLVVGVRAGAGGMFLPLASIGAIAVFYLVVVLVGPGVAAVEAGGWLLGPFPRGGLWPPDPALLTAIDAAAIGSQLPGMLTVALLSALALLLNSSGIELSSNQHADLSRELQVAGAANVVSGVGGGIPGFHALSLTNLGQRTGVTTRAVGPLAALVVLTSLVFGARMVAGMPRFVIGGVLAFLGLMFLIEWVVEGWRTLRRSDYAIVVLIVVVIASVGFLQGVAVGIVATTVLFLVTYARADVVKHVMDGTAYPSNVERAPADRERLRELASSITILELHGFLFFGTASRLFDLLRQRLEAGDVTTRYLVLDFRRVTGLDSSTVLSFEKAAQLALRHDATIVLSGLRGRVAEQMERSALARLDHVRVEEDVAGAVQWCEDQLLGASADAKPEPVPVRDWCLAQFGGDDGVVDRLLPYLEQEEVPAGTVIIEQGDRARDICLLEAGTVTVVLTDTNGRRRRLSRMLPGTVVGEIGMYLDTPRSASVVADVDAVISRLSLDALERMERDDPDVAAALHQLFARHLASRLSSTLRTIEALGD